MKRWEIHLYDVGRILFGNAPLYFLLEVAIRAFITYIVLLGVVKLMGKRMGGKLTFTEMAVMLMLGAIVSSAMQIPERGMLEGCFVLLLVVAIQRLVTLWMFKKPKVETNILGHMYLLVKDGILQTKDLKGEYISRTQLFGMLRSNKITNLGMIKRLYLETSGSFTMYQYKKPRAGLSLLPREDKAVFNAQQLVNDKKVCNICGQVYEQAHVPERCANCQSHEFVEAVMGNNLQ